MRNYWSKSRVNQINSRHGTEGAVFKNSAILAILLYFPNLDFGGLRSGNNLKARSLQNKIVFEIERSSIWPHINLVPLKLLQTIRYRGAVNQNASDKK